PGVSANGSWSNSPPFLGSRSTTVTWVGDAGSSQSTTVTVPHARRSVSSVRPVGDGGSYSAYIDLLSSPAATPPSRCTHRCGLRALGGVCPSVCHSARAPPHTWVLSDHPSTGWLSRSK